MDNLTTNYNFLKHCLGKKLSFAAFTLPGKNNFQFIAQKGEAKEITDLSEAENGFIIHPFDEKQHPILLIKDEFLFEEGESIKEFVRIADHSPRAKPSLGHFEEATKEEYFNTFNIFKKALDSREFQKLVLSRIKKVKAKKSFNIIDLFEKLNQNYQQSFNYIFYTPQSGIWLGASPEVLFEIKNNTAKTVALAGTQEKSNNYNWDSKEIEEQKFVVDYIENILKKQVSTISKNNETIEAANVAHLKTSFMFPADEIKNIPALIKKLHPTPAVCGLPKIEALNFINQNESHQRAYYTGFIGPYKVKKETRLYANLRCLHFDESLLNLFVGGGLTKDSVAEKEWQETELKAKTLESLL